MSATPKISNDFTVNRRCEVSIRDLLEVITCTSATQIDTVDLLVLAFVAAIAVMVVLAQ